MTLAPRPVVLFGRHYVWFHGGGRWCLLRDVDADARADRLADARQRVLGAARLMGKAAARRVPTITGPRR